jgi:HrpA-like RNA helicase
MAAARRSRRAPRASRRLLDIVVQLVMHTAQPGATTLVFLPGSAEIEAAQLSMLAYGEGRAPIEVFPLHSLVPRELQAAALEPPSAGMARVLLSTDIAESSLTLPDVTVVIDACMRRGPAWSEEKQMTSMNTWYASRASLAQRAGRSGRVQPGTVIRLISRAAAALLPAHDAPEMECVSLDGVVLRAKHLLTSQAERVQELLAGAVSPPAPARVEASLVRLVESGALTSEFGQLTTLGSFAALLPQLPLTVARALLIGLSAGAGADAVVLAAALCLEAAPFKQVLAMFAVTRTAFVEDTAAAMRVGAEADAGRYSEPITWCHIYRQYTTGVGVFPRPAWQRIRRQLGVRAMKAFATAVRSLARDVPRALAATGIQLSSRDLAAISRLGSGKEAAGSCALRTFDPDAFLELDSLDPDDDGACNSAACLFALCASAHSLLWRVGRVCHSFRGAA